MTAPGSRRGSERKTESQFTTTTPRVGQGSSGRGRGVSDTCPQRRQTGPLPSSRGPVPWLHDGRRGASPWGGSSVTPRSPEPRPRSVRRVLGGFRVWSPPFTPSCPTRGGETTFGATQRCRPARPSLVSKGVRPTSALGDRTKTEERSRHQCQVGMRGRRGGLTGGPAGGRTDGEREGEREGGVDSSRL